MARAFKVPVPKSYNNVTEAKLVQKGSNVWVQLPTNLVQDKRMSRKSVYMDDFNLRPFHNSRYRNVKAKVACRRSSYPQFHRDFSYPDEHLIPGYTGTDSSGITTDIDMNLNTSRKFGEPSQSFYEGMSRGKYYEGVKYKHSEPITAFLPVMSGNDGGRLGTSEHYKCSPRFETAQRLSTARSYNDKARDALPGLGWSALNTSYKNDTIDGGNFLENPLSRPDLENYEVKKSVAIHTPPRTSSRSRFDHSDPTNLLEPYSGLENSSRRHELEILTKVNPSELKLGQLSMDHLYQPSGYSRSHGYKVMAPAYEHGNSTFFHTGSDTRGSFTVAPDWVSERKQAVVVRH